MPNHGPGTFEYFKSSGIFRILPHSSGFSYYPFRTIFRGQVSQAASLFGLGFSGIMPCYPLLIRLFFPASEIGWRIAGQYLFSAGGMALGGWVGGVVFDLAGSYAPAFAAGLAFNTVNFFLVGILFVRRRPSRLQPAAA